MGLKKYDEQAEAKLKAQEEETEETVETENSEEENEETSEVVENIELEEVSEENIEKTDEDFLAIAEFLRSQYNQYAKNQKRWRFINTICFLVLEIVGFVLLILNERINNFGYYIGIPLFVIGIVVYFIVGKKLTNDLTAKAYEYIGKLFEKEADYIFNGSGAIDLRVESKGQATLESFTDAHFYQNIKNVRSRNMVTATLFGKTLVVSDLAGNVIVKNKTSPMFLGKYYDYFSHYSKANSYILYQLKGGELSRPLDNLEGLEVKEDTKKHVIYSNDDEWRKILNDKVLKELNKFKVDGKLIDVILSIRQGKICLGIDYCDEFMNIPVDQQVDVKIFKRMKNDYKIVERIFDILK